MEYEELWNKRLELLDILLEKEKKGEIMNLEKLLKIVREAADETIRGDIKYEFYIRDTKPFKDVLEEKIKLKIKEFKEYDDRQQLDKSEEDRSD